MIDAVSYSFSPLIDFLFSRYQVLSRLTPKGSTPVFIEQEVRRVLVLTFVLRCLNQQIFESSRENYKRKL